MRDNSRRARRRHRDSASLGHRLATSASTSAARGSRVLAADAHGGAGDTARGPGLHGLPALLAPALAALGARRDRTCDVARRGLARRVDAARSARVGAARLARPRAPGARRSRTSEAAYRGALGDAPGILLLAGTGSIALGRDGRGRWARAGGLGPLLGDEGSAFWIGREWLRIARRDAERARARAARAAHPTPSRASPRCAPAVLRARAAPAIARARAIVAARQGALAALVARRRARASGCAAPDPGELGGRPPGGSRASAPASGARRAQRLRSRRSRLAPMRPRRGGAGRRARRRASALPRRLRSSRRAAARPDQYASGPVSAAGDADHRVHPPRGRHREHAQRRRQPRDQPHAHRAAAHPPRPRQRRLAVAQRHEGRQLEDEGDRVEPDVQDDQLLEARRREDAVAERSRAITATHGVPKRGCTRASDAGICPAAASAKGSRELVRSSERKSPAVARSAPARHEMAERGPADRRREQRAVAGVPLRPVSGRRTSAAATGST